MRSYKPDEWRKFSLEEKMLIEFTAIITCHEDFKSMNKYEDYTSFWLFELCYFGLTVKGV